MAFMNFDILFSAGPVLTNWIGKFMNVLFESIGNFGWTVVVFTLIIKIALSPLDVWQKMSGRKQQKMNAKLQPEIAKLQKQYANRPDILKQKQAELMRGQQKGLLSSCLPMIVTMVVFVTVFGGFNAMVRFYNEKIVYDVAQAYIDAINSGVPLTTEQLSLMYQPSSWLWIENMFMPDSWSNIIPDFEKYIGTSIGGIGANYEEISNLINENGSYEIIMGPAMALHNKESFWQISKWNGYMILPILSIGTSILSTKLLSGQTMQAPTMDKTQQTTQKVMMYMMPVMFGFLSLLYSAAFALYLLMSNIVSVITAIIFNLVMKKKDKKASEVVSELTYKRKTN